MIDTSKYGLQGFGTPYNSAVGGVVNTVQGMVDRVTGKPKPGNTSVTGDPLSTQQYNPNAELPQGYTGFQQMPGTIQAQNAYSNMINSGGGMADTTAWMNSFFPQAQYTINNAVNQAMQRGSRMGMGASSPLMRMQGDIAGQTWAGILPGMLEQQMNQYNRGADRYLTAAGMQENNANNQLQNAMNWATNAFNLAGGYQGQQQGMLSNYANEMARMRAENNPYFNLAAQGAQMQNQVGPVQYNKSFLGNLFDTGLGVLSMGALGGAGSLNPANWFKKTP